jgi:hypothetical protein
VSALQSKIRDIRNKVVLFRDALTLQQQNFGQLLCLEHLPEAYEAALQEVVRRKLFSKHYSSACQQLFSHLKQIRDQEMTLRESFLSKHGRYVPKNLIPGLVDSLPDPDQLLKLLNCDKNLPNIETPELTSPTVPEREGSGEQQLHSKREASQTDLEEESARLLRALLPDTQRRADAATGAGLVSAPASTKVSDQKRGPANDSSKEAAYQKRIQALEDKLTETFTQASQQQEVATRMKELAERRQAQLLALQQQHEAAVAASAALQQQVTELTAARDKLQHQNGDYAVRLAKLGEENKLLVSNLKEAQNLLVEERNSRSETERLLLKLQEEHDLLKRSSAATKNDLLQMTERYESLTQRYTLLQKDMALLQAQAERNQRDKTKTLPEKAKEVLASYDLSKSQAIESAEQPLSIGLASGSIDSGWNKRSARVLELIEQTSQHGALAEAEKQAALQAYEAAQAKKNELLENLSRVQTLDTAPHNVERGEK